jgi:hypothetical protein
MTPSSQLPVPQVMFDNGARLLGLRVSAKDVSYQILHAKYLLEHLLQKFIARSANFDIVFFQGSCCLYFKSRRPLRCPQPLVI